MSFVGLSGGAALTRPALPEAKSKNPAGAGFWKKLKLTDKPGSVVDSHSSRPAIAHWLKQPTRVQYGPYHVNPYLALLRVEFTVPRTVTSRAVRSYRTLSPLPDPACAGHRRFALCCTGRGFPPQALPGTLPYGARTFLPSARLPRKGRRRSGDCLVSFGAQYRGFAPRCHPWVCILTRGRLPPSPASRSSTPARCGPRCPCRPRAAPASSPSPQPLAAAARPRRGRYPARSPGL